MKYFVYSLITLLQIGFLCNAAQVGFYKVGYVVNIPNNSSSYYSVALQPDGKIVAVGGQIDGVDFNGLIARFNTDGTLDTTFNAPNGFINTEGNTNSHFYNSVALQADGKIVAVGRTDQNNGNNDGLIARFNPNGELDQTFNNGAGFINADLPTNSDSYYSVAIQTDGKIVAVGQTDSDHGLIARFNTDGSLDTTTFNTGLVNGGLGFINTEGNTNSFAYYSVALQPDGKIVAVGQTDDNNGDKHGLIARFNTNGELDQTFNVTNGFINTEDGTDSSFYYSVALQTDGKILVVGRTDNGFGLIARYTTNGTLDTTFNQPNGFTNIPIVSSNYRSIKLQTDGKILVVGRADNGRGLIARFNTDGTLDNTFNETGFINADLPTNSDSYYSVAIQTDGKIVTVGFTSNNRSLIARFLSNGVLDAESNWNLQNFRESNNINKVSIGLLG
jgi:uncharacterized delta-60 repeat protein